VEAVADARLGTTLRSPDGAEAATVEHVLAAVFGLGIDNLEIVLTGPEAPIMDGSSRLYAEALLAAGFQDQAAPADAIEIVEPIGVTHGDRRAALLPAPGRAGLAIAVEIAFDDSAIGTQSLRLEVTPERFLSDIAPARTFGYLKDLEPMQRQGRGLGSSFNNSIVIDDGRVLNQEGLRFPDEFVRHKALDMIGDLALLGSPVIGLCQAVKPGHALTVALMQAVLAQPQAWRRRPI
jgi:UDP-3-O-[3-hydroxymyristoyl] N-acetylglucosamine deacetylase